MKSILCSISASAKQSPIHGIKIMDILSEGEALLFSASLLCWGQLLK